MSDRSFPRILLYRRPALRSAVLFGVAAVLTWAGRSPCLLSAVEPVHDRIVVLTFDDSVKSHFTVVRPILLEFGFGATFFITEGFDFAENKSDYMTWEQIAQLHQDGFEIGNHTRDHMLVRQDSLGRLPEQLEAIREACRRHAIPAPVSFAYPGNAFVEGAFPVLKAEGIRFARRGGTPEFPVESGRGFAYEPGFDHPLLIPSAGVARPDWTLDEFRQAVEQARAGRIAVLQFHGVPDRAHPWVNTEPERFRAFMRYLAEQEYTVISMRQLQRYVDLQAIPRNPREIIEDRQRTEKRKQSRDNYRTPPNEQELRYWLDSMFVGHGFAIPEIGLATGLDADTVRAHLLRLGLAARPAPAPKDGDRLRVLPYPGGRHPRIGFMDGAIRPQRETKVSVFVPWEGGGYVVADVPEAIHVNTADGSELIYLAHTHVPTRWTRAGVELPPLEWIREADGVLRQERELPNGVRFGTLITPAADSVRMEMWLTNGSRQPLSGLRVQNCVMLAAAPDFNQLSTDFRFSWGAYAACSNPAGDRWVITAWKPFHHAGGNGYCPCLHSDPAFPDCEPGETARLQGWLSFYEGTDIQSEMQRIERTGWDVPAGE